MVVGEASIHNIMGGMESTGGVRLHNHKRKLKQRFDIIKKLGQGTYGKVQLGINKETGQEVAIKTIKKCKIETEADLIRIRREIQIMSSVQHPNIIHIYEVFENREKMVLVMEYAAGGELYDYLSERKVLSEEEARRIFRQISIAVFYCHKHKICHRDLKLENILLDHLGNAKIADFGLSNVFDENRFLNTFCGSPLYASPEIVKGTPYHGPEVDCWSLGVLLYTLVYGAMPFDGSNFKRLTRQISSSDYFEPSNPSPASPLIRDMLTKCPSRRADIERICSHWWVNEGYEQNCLDIAEDLAAQTPVRLDLLLSLVPQSASAEELVVTNDQNPDVTRNMSAETLPPTRCHSVGSLMDLDRNNSDRIREIIDEDTKSTGNDTKRKLEMTPSMEETVEAGVKKKDRSRKKERNEEREPRAYRSTSRHHSAPIANAITEEAMEINPSMEIDLRDPTAAAACLELIKEAQSKSPSKERSKTPVIPDDSKQSQQIDNEILPNINDNINEIKPIVNKLQDLSDKLNVIDKEQPSNDMTTKSPVKVKAQKSKVNDISQDSNNLSNSVKLADGESNKLSEKTSVNEVAEKKNDVKKLSQKQMSVDSEEPAVPPAKPTERRRSKIFETAEKFNQLLAGTEPEKPKKIFIPGVNVGGAKKVFERKASLSSITPPTPTKAAPASKVIIDVANDNKKSDKADEKPTATKEFVKNDEERRREKEKKRAVDIITGALGKPPMQKKVNGSPPVTPQTPDSKNLGLKIQIAPNDVRNATVSVSTPVNTKYPNFEAAPVKPIAIASSVPISPESKSMETSSFSDDPPISSSKMEITLKSATLPRPRKTSKAEITLAGVKSPEPAFKSEVEAKIDAFHPPKLRTQKSEVAFPVAAVIQQEHRSSSLEPDNHSRMAAAGKERIIPIHVEPGHQSHQQSSTPPPSKPPMPQRSMSQRSSSLSRQSTADSDTDSALGSTVGPEPIRKSPREYIIPIAVEGGGYITPRSGSVEPESKTSTPTSSNPLRSKFGRGRRMGSLLSDASEDESPFSTLHRDNDDLLQRHMHRLRSSRPTRQSSEHADSLSSGEDDDDDGFELLTAENLFSTLLSRVRSLTQRLNVDDNRGTGFPRSRLLDRLGSNSSQGFWGLHEPLSRRLSESPFRRSLSRDTDRFGRKDSAMSSNPGTPTSVGARTTPSRESIFEMGSSNTLPRDKTHHHHQHHQPDETTETTDAPSSSRVIKKESQESCQTRSNSSTHENFTPSLTRRLSRQFIEQTRQSLPRSPSIPRDRLYRSSTEEPAESLTSSVIPERSEYRSKSSDRSLRRTNSLLESNHRPDYRTPRRSVSLFEDDDELLPPLPRQIMTLGRKYRDPIKTLVNGGIRRDVCLAEKIQEEPVDEPNSPKKTKEENVHKNDNQTSDAINLKENRQINDQLNNQSTTPNKASVDALQTQVPTNKEDVLNCLRADAKEFENRLLAAENLIKESKLRNLNIDSFDSNYTNSETGDKELFPGSINDLSSIGLTKRRSCIPGLRLRSASLTRDVLNNERRKSLAYTQNSNELRDATPERSLLSKFFRGGSTNRDSESKDKSPEMSKTKRRISRFLRPDFFDTPREESQYVKEKEAQKAAENERRKSRFMKRKNQNKEADVGVEVCKEDKPEKELKNEANEITRDHVSENSIDDKINNVLNVNGDAKIEVPNSGNNFVQDSEKKHEKLQSGDELPKINNLNTIEKVKEEEDVGCQNNSANLSEKLHHSVESEVLLPKAASFEDLSLSLSDASTAPATAPTATKSRVSSVLGLFKNDSKTVVNGAKQQSTLLSKFKKNIYKGSRSDTNVITGEPSTNSKIPTKFKASEITSKVSKKSISDSKKSPDKNIEAKKSPPKEKTKEKSPLERLSLERKIVTDNKIKSPKKLSPEKITEVKTEKIEKSSVKDKSVEKEMRKSSSPEKSDISRNSSRLLLSSKKPSPDKIVDIKKVEQKNGDVDEKKVLKTKEKKTTTSKNGSVPKLQKGEETEKKVKKIVKKDTTVDKDGTSDGTKKKKIVRVVRKAVKKSENTENSNNGAEESREKEKPTRTLLKKITSSVKKENSLDNVAKKKDKSPESKLMQVFSDSNIAALENKTLINTEKIPVVSKNLDNVTSKQKNNNIVDASRIKNSIHESDVKSRNNRSNLKLDLSKIPQHTFKTTSGGGALKKEAWKSSDTLRKSYDSISKMTHHANITGNKMIIDKPLVAADMTELERQASVFNEEENNSSVAENQPLSKTDHCETVSEKTYQKEVNSSPNIIKKIDEKMKEIKQGNSFNPDCHQYNENHLENSTTSLNPKLTPDHTDDILSPMEDAESFDSWSICSNDLNHRSSMDLYSPTSSAYSPSIRSDHSESIIDRIRRKSFYSRFNERKRKNSLTVPSSTSSSVGISSSTLPRKYSFHSTRDIDRKNSRYASPSRRNCERAYSLYNEDLSGFRKSPVDRDRYSDVGCSLGSFFNDLKSPGDQYGSSSGSYYDSLRKYRTSTPDSSYKKYPSTDLHLDNNIDLYKRPLVSSSSALNDSISEYRSNLPRRYGSVTSDVEPKTAEYYEELLSPTRLDYLSGKKSPDIGIELAGKYENCQYNGHLDVLQSGVDKWRGHLDKIHMDSPEGSDKSHGEERSSSQTTNESKELSATCPDADTATLIVE